MFGVTSLMADLVYEGARSAYGPLLASLGASAAIVGLVTGAGEAAALVLRVIFGPWADRTGHYWRLTTIGYALTVVSVPMLAVTPFLGAAGLGVAAVLILLERTGKAIRSPAKSALLAQVALSVGRGKGFGVHKALDQTGAFLGPLLVAGLVSLTGALWTGYAVLAIPGVLALVVLAATWRHTPEPEAPTDGEPRSWWAAMSGAGLPRAFFWYAAAASLMTGGLVTFGLIGYHLVVSGLLPAGTVPIAYAAAMLVEALAALVVGTLFDRVGPAVLYAVPLLVALVPGLAFGQGLAVVLGGVALWGLATGVQDSTVKALVADLVPSARRAGAYGVFAAFQGAAALIGGLVAGYLVDRSIPALVLVVAAAQVVAVVLLWQALRRARTVTPAD